MSISVLCKRSSACRSATSFCRAGVSRPSPWLVYGSLECAKKSLPNYFAPLCGRTLVAGSAFRMNTQVVAHTGYARNAGGAGSRQFFVALIFDAAFQCDRALLHDDVDRGHIGNCVALQL